MGRISEKMPITAHIDPTNLPGPVWGFSVPIRVIQFYLVCCRPTCFMAIHCPTCLEIWNRDLWLKTEVRWRDSASCLLHGIVHATKPHSFHSRLYINSNLPRFITSCWVSRECECPVIVRVVRIVIVWISSDAKSALFGKTRRFQLMFSFLLHNIVINLRVMHHQLRIF